MLRPVLLLLCILALASCGEEPTAKAVGQCIASQYWDIEHLIEQQRNARRVEHPSTLKGKQFSYPASGGGGSGAFVDITRFWCSLDLYDNGKFEFSGPIDPKVSEWGTYRGSWIRSGQRVSLTFTHESDEKMQSPIVRVMQAVGGSLALIEPWFDGRRVRITGEVDSR